MHAAGFAGGPLHQWRLIFLAYFDTQLLLEFRHSEFEPHRKICPAIQSCFKCVSRFSMYNMIRQTMLMTLSKKEFMQIISV